MMDIVRMFDTGIFIQAVYSVPGILRGTVKGDRNTGT